MVCILYVCYMYVICMLYDGVYVIRWCVCYMMVCVLYDVICVLYDGVYVI